MKKFQRDEVSRSIAYLEMIQHQELQLDGVPSVVQQDQWHLGNTQTQCSCSLGLDFGFYLILQVAQKRKKRTTKKELQLVTASHTCSTQKFPGQGLNQSCSCQPTLQPQQLGIPALSVTYTAAHGNSNPLPTERGQGLNLHPHGYQSGSLLISHNRKFNFFNYFNV